VRCFERSRPIIPSRALPFASASIQLTKIIEIYTLPSYPLFFSRESGSLSLTSPFSSVFSPPRSFAMLPDVARSVPLRTFHKYQELSLPPLSRLVQFFLDFPERIRKSPPAVSQKSAQPPPSFVSVTGTLNNKRVTLPPVPFPSPFPYSSFAGAYRGSPDGFARFFSDHEC